MNFNNPTIPPLEVSTIDDLSDAAAVLDMVDAFLGGVDDLETFQDSSRYRPIGGLKLTLKAVRKTVRKVVDKAENV